MKTLAKIFSIVTISVCALVIIDLILSSIANSYASVIWSVLYEEGFSEIVEELVDDGFDPMFINMVLQALYTTLIGMTIIPLVLAILLLTWLCKGKKGLGFAISLMVCSLPLNIFGILAGLFAILIKKDELVKKEEVVVEQESVVLSPIRSSELDMLNKMYEEGRITQAEYEDLKNRILTK